MFLVIFAIIIIKITIIIIIIIIATIIENFSGHTRKTSFLTSEKRDQVARIRGMGREGIWAIAERKRFFPIDVFPIREGF